MSYWKIALRNMLDRRLASALTALSMALGVAAMICVLVVHAVAVRQFSQDAQGYHLIVGRKGSDLQLVLNTVFHIGQTPQLMPYSLYREFTDGRFAELVEVAVPYCLGDSFVAGERLYRVVGTTPDLFDKIPYRTNDDGTPRTYQFSSGRNFKPENCFEAVIGSMVAAQAGLKVGDHFNPTHGIGFSGDKHEEFEVVGILEPTETANDRAVFVNLEGFLLLDGHALSAPKEPPPAPPPSQYKGPLKGTIPPEIGHDATGAQITPLPEPQREVSAILVRVADQFGVGATVLSSKLNKDFSGLTQAVAPAGVVTRLLEQIVGPVQLILLVLTVLIIIVAAIGILVSIYNSMNERSHDIAVMRALGASRVAVMLIVLFESILIASAGGLLGILLGHGLVGLAAPYIEAQAGVRLNPLQFDPWELIVVPALVALAAVAGLMPALTAYRTDVAKQLSK
jgi:putative ABC transport system permease protein